MPTIQELNTLIYCSNGKLRSFSKEGYDTVSKEVFSGCGSDTRGAYQKPTIFHTVFPNTPRRWFWSASSHTDNSDDAWVVNFDYGGDSVFNRTGDSWVRLVRSGQ